MSTPKAGERTQCICEDGFGLNLSCNAHGTASTPQPWRVCKNGEGDFEGLTVESDFGLVVRLPDSSDAENEANAHVLAAAPELLEQCKALLELYRLNRSQLFGTDMHEQAARAAIAKAEGTQK